MLSKQFIVSLFVIIVATTNARMIRMNRGSSCSCRHRIQNERDDAINKYNDLADNLDKLNEFITLNNCPVGHIFDYNNSIIDKMNVKCNKCPKNYYRTKQNTTCLHCPEGFVSNEGSIICNKGKKEELVDTLYCSKGNIIGNDPYAEYGNSCIECKSEKKEYMPFNNHEDKCLICQSGSIIKNNNCIKCPIGYYESNNKCIECNIGTYNDIEGSIKCKKCENDKSLAYYSTGSNNCEDSYLFSLNSKINEVLDINMISKPIIYSLQSVSGIIYSNRKTIIETSSTLTMFGGFGIMTYLAIISP
tara:strand:- start:3333 stop:4241 length:909 start_codon:yes stop_codon:yes gene_type:complete